VVTFLNNIEKLRGGGRGCGAGTLIGHDSHEGKFNPRNSQKTEAKLRRKGNIKTVPEVIFNVFFGLMH
jgi:hypothetical protein